MNHKYSCNHAKIIVFNKNNLLLEPYLLGLLLGDGGFTGNVITFTNAEDDIIKRLSDMVEDIGMEAHCRDFENHKQLTICLKPGDTKNKLNNIIKELGLFGADSRQKFIPEMYKTSSVIDRLKILSGIINTDGNIDDKGCISICTYSERMYNDIKDISNSLGMITTFSEYDRTTEDSTKKYDKEIEYRIRIFDNYRLLNLSKKHLSKFKDKKKYVNKIIDINKSNNKEDVIGIMLDDDNYRVVTNNYLSI